MQIKIELEIGVSPALMALIEMASNGSFGDRVPAPRPAPAKAPAEPVAVEPAAVAAAEAAPAGDPNEVDAAGWPWSAELHAATRGTTKDGLWRMKVGVARPDPKPGFPKAAAEGTGTGSPAGSTAAAQAAESPATAAADAGEDDEFAAFRQAAANADANDAAAAAAVPARKWTDADLGALCNQAAVKLGDPAPVKTIIGEFVPEGQVPHSRNVPEADRPAFAVAVEKAAGITFAG